MKPYLWLPALLVTIISCSPKAEPARVTFSKPLEGSHVTEGSTIDVSLDATGVPLKKLAVYFEPLSQVLPELKTEPPYEFKTPVPIGKVGQVTLTAIGFDKSDNRVTASISMVIDPVTGVQSITSLSVQPDHMTFLKPGDMALSIHATAKYPDGSSKTIAADQLSIVSSNPQIAAVRRDGYVTAVGPGNCTINVSYANLAQQIAVEVCRTEKDCQ